MRTPAGLFLLFWFCIPPDPAFSSLQEVREVHYQMGTFLELTLWHSDTEAAKRLIRDAVQEVHRLEEILSNFDADSAVSRFNQKAGLGRIRLPADLFKLLRAARGHSASTGGYFDVTVGPLVELWRETLSRSQLPDQEMLAQARHRVGFEKLKIYDGGEAELLLAGMKIDLGGIGKGYAVDRIAEQFKAVGVGPALINFGGSSIYGVGSPPGEMGWEVGIQGTDGRLRGVIRLRDMALSTSGSMGHFWTVNGKRYGHLIDPKNGMPITDLRMATVVAPTATAAEALTKPLVIIGGKALPMAERLPQTEAVVTSEQDPVIFSNGFRPKTAWREVPAP
jgi:thiamine biosynthesis lipoprotein